MAKGRFAPKFHIKTGDKVLVIAGSAKGKDGVVLQVFPDKNRAIVEGVKMVKRHIRPNAMLQQPGSIQEKEASVHISNLMLIDPKSGEPTKVGRRVEEGKIVRYAKKTGQTI
jgi:large subunit ribosomal protein L24